eukprot:223614_1
MFTSSGTLINSTSMSLLWRITFMFSWLFILHHHGIADTIDCKTDLCSHTAIDCLPHEDCSISCPDTQSCIESVITCPLNANCDIYCTGAHSCEDTIINATGSSGNVNIFCQHSNESIDTAHCRNIAVYGSILSTNTGNMDIRCEGVGVCSSADIHCALYGDCTMDCQQDTSCQSSHIIGPTHGELTIDCNGTNACFDAVFNGSSAFILDVTVSFMMDLSIFCPINTNSSTNCFLQDQTNYASEQNHQFGSHGIQIYAVHGWQDVHMDDNATFEWKGQMFCGEKYEMSCDIASDHWSCVHVDHICNDIDHTYTTTNIDYTYTTETLHHITGITGMVHNSLTLVIVISIGAVSVLIACVFCVKWIGKKVVSKKSNDKEGNAFEFVFKSIVNAHVDGSDVADFVDNEEEKNASSDPLEISSIASPLGRQRSVTNTFLSAAISELDSPKCIQTRSRLFSEGSRKISDVSVDDRVFYTPIAPIANEENYITPRPRPPPPRRTKWAGNLSPVCSKNNSDVSNDFPDIDDMTTVRLSIGMRKNTT